MTFFADASLRDETVPAFSVAFSGYLKTRDGTVFRVDTINHGYWWSSSLSWIRDPNGNKITFTRDANDYLTSIKDSLNRQITIERNVTQAPYGVCDRVSYKGFAGSNRVIHVSRANLDTALRSDFAAQGPRRYNQLFSELNGSSTDLFDPSVITAVWLPDGDGVTRRYRFPYNPLASWLALSYQRAVLLSTTGEPVYPTDLRTD